MQHFYFDHNATSPVAPEVLRDLRFRAGRSLRQRVQYPPFRAGRQSSGWRQARRAVAAAHWLRRARKSSLPAAARNRIISRSSASLARREAAARHVITSAIEHPAVLNACAQLEREGVEVTCLPVGADGIVDPDDVRAALRPNTALISIMHANNETGRLQPIARDCAHCARGRAFRSTADGVQTARHGFLWTCARSASISIRSAAISSARRRASGALYVRKGIDARADAVRRPS